MSEIDHNCDTTNNAVNRILVGNKTDIVDNVQVSEEEANSYAESIRVEHFRCSAKESSNVNTVSELNFILSYSLASSQP